MKLAALAVILFASFVQTIPVDSGIDSLIGAGIDAGIKGLRLIAPKVTSEETDGNDVVESFKSGKGLDLKQDFEAFNPIDGAGLNLVPFGNFLEVLKPGNGLDLKQGLEAFNPLGGAGLNLVPFGNFLQGYENFGKSIVEGIRIGGDIGKGIIQGVRNGTRAGFNAGEAFAEALGNAAETFITASSDFSNSVAVATQDFFNQSASNFIAVIEALQQTISVILFGIGDGIQRKLLLEVQDQLGKASVATEDAQNVVNYIRDELRDNIEQNASDILSEWNNFARVRLANAFEELNGNRRSYKRVQNLVNDFVNTYSGYINQCAEEAIGGLEVYESKAHDAINRYQKTVKTLITEVQTCLQSSNLVCQRKISKELTKLRNAPREFSVLNNEGYVLLDTNFADLECVQDTLSEFRSERENVNNQIDTIIANAKKS